MGLEIAARGFGPIGPDRFEPGRIGREQIDRIAGRPAVVQFEQRSSPVRIGELEVDPASFLPPPDKPRIAQDTDMARHPGLALPQHLGQFADGQLHRAQQRQDAQPRRVGQRLEKRGKLEVPGHVLRI